MILGFEHVAIAAVDTRNLANWYIRMFDLRVVFENGKEPPTFLLKARNGMVLEILPASCGQPASYKQTEIGFRHLALTVDDYAEAEAHLRANGITDFVERRETDISKLLFFRDPEGNILHFIWRSKPLP